MNKINLGKLSIIFRMLLVFGFLALTCGTFSYAETLPELNQSTDATRSYTFTSGESATLEENMGVTSSGKFTITGLNKNQNSILFNSYSGFVVRQIQTTLNISNVTVTGANSTIGSVIYNTVSDASINLSDLNIVSNSILSQDDALGGAIYSNSAMTIRNSSFKGNYAVTEGSSSSAKGGAIYARKSIELIADSDNVEIVDNYTQDSSGAKDDNAIYMADSSTLTLNAKNNGKVLLHDNISGDNGYNVVMRGDGTGKIGLYNSINNADEISVSNVDVTTANGKIENHKLDNLNIGENVNFTVDVNLEDGTADTISSNNGNGTVNLSEISVIAGSEDEKTVQVLKDAGNLKLNIEQLQSKQVSELQSTMYNSSILADSISLATTDTTDDSFTISGWKDVLYELVKDSTPSHMIKNFVFDTDTEYVLTKDLTDMPQESILTIYNTSGAKRGVLNANGHSLFKLVNPISSVTLRDITIKNANTSDRGAVAYIANNTSGFTAYNSTIENNSSDGNGGAIYIKNGTLSLNDTTVSGNKSDGDGGALYITDEANVELVNVDFTDNTSSGNGGAIYTDKDITITASNGTSTFDGNNAGGNGNDIYVGTSGATVTLKADNKGTININDGISGTDNKYNLVITGSSNGNVNLNGYVNNANVTLNKTTLNMGHDDLLKGNSLNLQGGTLNLINNEVGNMDLSNLKMSGTTKVNVDVDLANKTMDRVNADSYGSIKGTLNVSNINILSDSAKRFTKVFFADPAQRKHVKSSVYKAYSPVYRYFVTYNRNDGYFTFNRGAEDISFWFNPAVLSGAIAQQTAYMNQLNNYNTALYHSDTYMMLPRDVRLNTGNVCDNMSDTMTFVQIQEEIKSVWVRPYTSAEHIHLNRGPKISSLNYGTLIGGDSDMIDIGKGWKYVYSGYVGYTGNNYDFENVNATQQGALVGTTTYLYKNDFFNALTANVGWMMNDSDTIYGTDIMNLITTGFSDKIGYNFELANGKLIIQPSITMGYTIVFSTDYTSRNNVRIDSDPLHAVHFVPGLKIVGNFANGWQPYATINVICSFIDKTHFTANNIQIPLMSLDPYVEYGLGVQKRWADKYSGYAQATIRNGGRRGISFLFGFRYMLGQIFNNPNKLPHVDARPRKVFFKERKRPDITVEKVKQKITPEKRRFSREKEEKPKFRINVFDVFKNIKKKMTYSYNTDVSAKVVTDTYSDGVIMPSVNGVKRSKKEELNDYKDMDRVNGTYEKSSDTIIQEVDETVRVKHVQKVPQQSTVKTPQTVVKPQQNTSTQPKQQPQVVKPQQNVAKPQQNNSVQPKQQPQVVQPKASESVNTKSQTNSKQMTTEPVIQPAPENIKRQEPVKADNAQTVKQKEVQETKPVVKQETKPARNKTDNIQRRVKNVNKALYINQTKYEEKKETTYKDYDIQVVDFRF